MEPNSRINPVPFWSRTFSSLRYRDYRLYWFGSCTEHTGQQMEIMASAWLMMELTRSPFYLGLLTCCRIAPLFFFALLGGVVADRRDRRRVLLGCFMASAVVSTSLLVLARTGTIAPWHLLLAAVLNAAIKGINHPARDALIPNLTPKHEWMNAIALDTISVRTAAILGAPLAGGFIASFGTAPLFGVSTVGMLLASFWLMRINVPAVHPRAGTHGAWQNLGKGLEYVVANGLIVCLVLVFALREFQSEMSSTFLPFFADSILHAGPTGFGYLNMAEGIGGVVGLFGIATLGNYRHKGKLIICCGILVGFLLIAFSVSQALLLSFLLLIAASGFGTVFENVGRTALQGIIPDEMRGRVMSLREVIRGFVGAWVAYGLGLGGEYAGVVSTSMLLGVFIILCVVSIYVFLPAFRKL
ncbi:MAG: MFS transporter [Deltaproteobacteria bacterium]|nr:MFS transporter [Deltaproteobacteria bacterium]